MNILIHDLEKDDISSIIPGLSDDLRIISEDGSIKNCIGCFGCWVKTPAVCIIRDSYGDMGEMLSKSDKVTLVSKCYYGGFSPFIKNVIDRSISYLHPYFEIRNEEMHHKNRYENHFVLQVIFYGDTITDEEKQTAANFVKAISVNLDCRGHEITFVNNLAEMEGLTI